MHRKATKGAATCVVNSYNEWDPLEEVIVGILDGAVVLPWDVALAAVKPKSDLAAARMLHRVQGGRPVPDHTIDAAQVQLDEFVRILEGEGVTVRRPDAIDHTEAHATPDWESPGGNCQANPRDVLIVIGNEIIEAPMSWRSRYFEFLAYRRLVQEYFREGARWTAAPKPRLADDSYRKKHKRGREYVTTEVEPLFDAADMARCGRDIFIQRSHVTNDFGIEWLRRHLGDDYRLHTVEFEDDRALHIDATFVPLAPGKLLVNPDRPLKRVPDVLRGSDWDMLEAPRSTFPRDDAGYESFQWLSMNMLSLDEKRVIVEASEEPMIRALEGWGLEPIPCAFRENYRFGGSFHCATVDIRRNGGLQTYF